MRSVDADELRKHAFTVYQGNGIELEPIEVVPLTEIDNASEVAVICKDCDGYEAGYSAGLKDAERPQDDPMKIVAGKCPIEVGGNCPLKPQGEWIDEGQYAEGYSEHAYACKKCGYHIIENPNMIYENRFCKHCGADMQKGGKEE